MFEQKLRKIKEGNIIDNESSHPQIFDAENVKDLEKIEHLLDETPDILVVDKYEEMLRELFIVEHPSLKLYQKKLEEEYASWLVGQHGENSNFIHSGIWVYYPWNKRIVHTLSKDQYHLLRTARNHNLVTIDEQNTLRKARIGIIGLSVGQSTALTLTISAIGQSLRLADPDTVDASNLNRIHGGIADVSLKKTVVLSRLITEVDPFAKPQLYPVAINEDNIEEFLIKDGKLDVVVDAFDDVRMKIKLRIAARKHRIALIMATDVADGATVEIERYDLDPATRMFGGRVDEKELASMPVILETKDMARMAILMIGIQSPPPRMIDSIRLLGVSIAGYPQLALASFLSGSLATYVIKRIALGDTEMQSRVSISYEKLFSL